MGYMGGPTSRRVRGGRAGGRGKAVAAPPEEAQPRAHMVCRCKHPLDTRLSAGLRYRDQWAHADTRRLALSQPRRTRHVPASPHAHAHRLEPLRTAPLQQPRGRVSPSSFPLKPLIRTCTAPARGPGSAGCTRLRSSSRVSTPSGTTRSGRTTPEPRSTSADAWVGTHTSSRELRACTKSAGILRGGEGRKSPRPRGRPGEWARAAF
jgi:hypothetical protein